MQHLRRAILLPALALLLLSCTRRGELLPEEVLRRAVSASPTLQSSRFTIDGDVSVMQKDARANVKAAADGSLLDGGKRSQFTLDLDGTIQSGQESYAVKGRIEMILLSLQDTYVRLESVSITPAFPLLPPEVLAGLQGKWWKLPPSDGTALMPTVTPDPGLLRAQSEVVSVTEDKGIAKIHGRNAYRYAVIVDREKLLSFLRKAAEEKQQEFRDEDVRSLLSSLEAEGELWIDAEAFFVHRLAWTVSSLRGAHGDAEFSGRVSIDMRDHNALITIQPPRDAQLLSPETLMRGGDGTLFPPLTP